MSVRAAILGPTGYAGYHLIDILLRHPQAELSYLASHRDELPDIREEFPRLQGRLSDEQAICRPIDAQAIAAEADVAFLALPHRAAMHYAPRLLEAGLRVVDLSADYRLEDPALYEQTYEHAHEDVTNLGRAVYGLTELNRGAIAQAKLVANPGCYPTAAGLAVAPLLSHALVKQGGMVINASSGVTGAGRKAAQHLHFAEHNEGYFAYGRIGGHRHQPEIEQTLSRVAGQAVSVLFVPHLLPVDQGILETIYLQPADPEVSEEELVEAFEDAYADEPFVRLRQAPPNIKHVAGTNYCDLAVRLVGPAEHRTVVVFAALDNIIKGASGQAVQNMNLMAGLGETTGLV